MFWVSSIAVYTHLKIKACFGLRFFCGGELFFVCSGVFYFSLVETGNILVLKCCSHKIKEILGMLKEGI